MKRMVLHSGTVVENRKKFLVFANVEERSIYNIKMESQQIAQKIRFFPDAFDDLRDHREQNHQFFQPGSLSQDEQVDHIGAYLILTNLNIETIEGKKSLIKQKKQEEEEAKVVSPKIGSAFHNLQKHLITLLKRIVHLKRVDLPNSSQGLQAYELWKIFLEGKGCSKKSLYIIVGLASQNKENMAKMSLSFPELGKMMLKFPFQQIEEGQSLLRENIHEYLSQISKSVVQNSCKMNYFEKFYAYLATFMEALRGEGLAMRMPKKQKLKLLDKEC